MLPSVNHLQKHQLQRDIQAFFWLAFFAKKAIQAFFWLAFFGKKSVFGKKTVT
jgi:hypothetical protein